MDGIVIFPESKEELFIASVVTCDGCAMYNSELHYCRWWKGRTVDDGWCYKGECEDTNDLFEEDS